MLNPRFLPVVLALAISSSSCFFRKSTTAVFTPPPPARSAPKPKAPVEASLPPAPPDIAGDPMAALPDVPNTMPQTLEPPRPAPPARRAAPPAPPKAVNAGPAPSADTPAPPQLGQIFTPDQARDYNRTLNESLDRVRKALVVLAGKNLNAEQSEVANRIRTFSNQAEQAREQDLVTAVSLARRADLLAQDLLDRLP